MNSIESNIASIKDIIANKLKANKREYLWDSLAFILILGPLFDSREAIFLSMIAAMFFIAANFSNNGEKLNPPVLLVIFTLLVWVQADRYFALFGVNIFLKVFLASVQFLIIAWGAVCMIQKRGSSKVATTILCACAVLLVYNFLYALVINQINLFDISHIVELKGRYVHKNTAGELAAISVILGLFLYTSKNYKLQIGLVIFALYFLYQTGAKTAMISMIISVLLTCAVFALRYIVQKKYIAEYLTFAGFFVVLLLAILISFGLFGFDFFGEIFPKNPTLTHRLQIWESGYESFVHTPAETIKSIIDVFNNSDVRKELFIGYGPNSGYLALFIKEFNTTNYQEIASLIFGENIPNFIKFSISHLHNSYLAMLFDYGIFGFISLIIIFYLLPAFVASRNIFCSFSVASFGLMTFFTIYSITETLLPFRLVFPLTMTPAQGAFIIMLALLANKRGTLNKKT